MKHKKNLTSQTQTGLILSRRANDELNLVWWVLKELNAVFVCVCVCVSNKLHPQRVVEYDATAIASYSLETIMSRCGVRAAFIRNMQWVVRTQTRAPTNEKISEKRTRKQLLADATNTTTAVIVVVDDDEDGGGAINQLSWWLHYYMYTEMFNKMMIICLLCDDISFCLHAIFILPILPFPFHLTL